MISAVAILMLFNGIRIFLKSKKNTINEIGCVMEFMTPFSFLHFFVSSFFSSDFTDESGGILAYRISHGISRNFGRWPMARARYMLLLFFVTQISQMTQIFLRGDYFVPQISQIYTDFSLWDIFQFQGVSAPTGQVASAKIRV